MEPVELLSPATPKLDDFKTFTQRTASVNSFAELDEQYDYL
jgi:hypothetical protein